MRLLVQGEKLQDLTYIHMHRKHQFYKTVTGNYPSL